MPVRPLMWPKTTDVQTVSCSWAGSRSVQNSSPESMWSSFTHRLRPRVAIRSSAWLCMLHSCTVNVVKS